MSSTTPSIGTTMSPPSGVNGVPNFVRCSVRYQPLSSGVAGGGAKPSLMLPYTLRLPPARITSTPGSPKPRRAGSVRFAPGP
ncbi:hypothetical protein D9M72_205520 [compost metagenome]